MESLQDLMARIDWTDPAVDIIDELTAWWYEANPSIAHDDAMILAEGWAERVFTRYAQ